MDLTTLDDVARSPIFIVGTGIASILGLIISALNYRRIGQVRQAIVLRVRLSEVLSALEASSKNLRSSRSRDSIAKFSDEMNAISGAVSALQRIPGFRLTREEGTLVKTLNTIVIEQQNLSREQRSLDRLVELGDKTVQLIPHLRNRLREQEWGGK